MKDFETWMLLAIAALWLIFALNAEAGVNSEQGKKAPTVVSLAVSQLPYSTHADILAKLLGVDWTKWGLSVRANRERFEITVHKSF